MSIIYKYTIMPPETSRDASIAMPLDAKLLSVQCQHHEIVIWASVDPSAETSLRWLRIIPTGVPFPDGDPGTYVGTVQHSTGLVFHFFDLGYHVAG